MLTGLYPYRACTGVLRRMTIDQNHQGTITEGVGKEIGLVEAIVESKRTNTRMQGIGGRGSRNQSVSFTPICGGGRREVQRTP